MAGPAPDVVLDALPHGVVVYEPERGEIVAANEPFCDLVDRPQSTLVGTSVGEVVVGDATAASLVGPDCLDAARATKTLTTELRGPDGTVPVAVDLRPAGESWVAATVRDASDGRERRLRRFETIVETLDDVVYALDAEGRFVYVSPSVADVKGVDPDAFLGTHFAEWVDEATAARARREMTAIEQGEQAVATLEYDFQRANGERIDAELRFVSTTLPGGDPGWAGLIRDITERVEHRREIERQNERLERVARLVSHDLRNPLAVAQGFLDFAREEHGENESFDRIDASLSRIDVIAGDLLTMARTGSPEDRVPVVLERVVERAWENVVTGDAALDVALDGYEVTAVPGRLQQVVENLFRNAIEHGSTGDPGAGSDPTPRSPARATSDGGTEVDAAAVETTDGPGIGRGLTVTAGRLPADDGFFVADDGPGIPPDLRDRVFERGVSGRDGTGLGLAIVRSVADEHGWDVAVTESDGGGARFEFRT